jgi:O-antigen/teichoic acid export membrane protein
MSQKRQLVSNSVSMLVNKLVQGGTSFVLTASIARNLGAQSLGQYLLALSYYYIFVSIASQGLKTLFTREVAINPQKTSAYLVSGTLLQFILSVIGYVAMVSVIHLLPYSNQTSFICYILGLSIIPFALSNITEAILQAQERMHLIALSTAPVYILRVLVMIWLMTHHFGIEYVAGVLVISESLIFIIQWFLLINIVKPEWRINKEFIGNILYASRTLFAIEGMGIIASKVDILSLSLLGNEFLIGLYGAVSQLMQPFSLVSRSLVSAAFPRMSKAVQLGRDQQRQEAENIIKILLCLCLPFCSGVAIFSNEILSYVYNDVHFLQAAPILRIFSLMLIPTVFSLVFSYTLIANGLEKITLIEVSIATTLGGLSSIILISNADAEHKLMGAVLAGLIMAVSSLVIFSFAMRKYLFSVRLWPVISLPSLITTLMLIVLIGLKETRIDFPYTFLLSVCAYLFLATSLVIRELGGVNYVKEKFFNKG